MGCPADAFEWKDEVFTFHNDRCVQCTACFGTGLFSGILGLAPEILSLWPPTIADAASAYINAIGKEKFLFLNYAFDISPWCDCVNFHDKPLVPNIGVFPSKDPVAIDMACLEAVEALAGMPESKAEEFGFGEPGTERFTNCSSMGKISQWSQCNAAQFNGIGTTEYVLVESDPGEDTDFWFPPYTPEKPFGLVNKKALMSGNYDGGDFSYELPRLSLAELHTKPKGKVESR